MAAVNFFVKLRTGNLWRSQWRKGVNCVKSWPTHWETLWILGEFTIQRKKKEKKMNEKQSFHPKLLPSNIIFKVVFAMWVFSKSPPFMPPSPLLYILSSTSSFLVQGPSSPLSPIPTSSSSVFIIALAFFSSMATLEVSKEVSAEFSCPSVWNAHASSWLASQLLIFLLFPVLTSDQHMHFFNTMYQSSFVC